MDNVDNKVNCTIYILCHPKTLERRYVGQTVTSLKKRLSSHINTAKRGKLQPVCKWIRKILKQNQLPIIEEIQQFAVWNKDEIQWIAKLREQGCRLLNLTNGGEGRFGYKHKISTCRKISAGNQNRSEEEQNKRTEAIRAAMTEEVCTKISCNTKGKKRTLEQRLNISNAHKRMIKRKEQKAFKQYLASKPRKQSEETIRKRIESRKRNRMEKEQ